MRDPNKGLKFNTFEKKITHADDGWCPVCGEMNCICPRGNGLRHVDIPSILKYNSISEQVKIHTAVQNKTFGHKDEE